MSHLGGSPKMKTIRKGIRKFSWLLILCLSLVFLISPSNAGASDLANEDVVIQDQSETTVEHETEYLESEKKNDNSELEELKNENLEPENPVIETLESESEDVILENQPETKNEVLAGPKIEISEPLTVLRSQVMNGEFMPISNGKMRKSCLCFLKLPLMTSQLRPRMEITLHMIASMMQWVEEQHLSSKN